MFFYNKNRKIKKPDTFLYSSIILKTLSIYRNSTQNLYMFYSYSIIMSISIFNSNLFSTFIFKKFKKSFIFYYNNS